MSQPQLHPRKKHMITLATIAAQIHARHLYPDIADLWVAMDASGSWWLYFEEPTCWPQTGCWTSSALDYEQMPEVPPVGIEWKATMTKVNMVRIPCG